MSNNDMFGRVLKYINQTEMHVLEDTDYEFMYNNGQNDEFDVVAQMLAFLQMTCFKEIIESKYGHAIINIRMRAVNAELWYKKFRNRIDINYNFYIH